MTIEELKGRLTHVQQRGSGYTASCPCSHNHKDGDASPSLSFKQDSQSGKILLYCHRGCSFEEICAAIGCSPSDFMPDKQMDARYSFLKWYAKQEGLTLEKVYSYEYDSYCDGLAKVRFRKADGKKTFRWIKDDPTKKSGVSMTHEGCQNRLYIRGNTKENTVFLVEGEKDADNFHQLTGWTTASVENGATLGDQRRKWLPEYTQQLTGSVVFVLWDNDDAGRHFARMEAEALHESAGIVLMLDLLKVWPECPEKGDISDMIKALGHDEALKRINELLDMSEEYSDKDAITSDSVNAIDTFLQKIQTEAYKPIPTGINGIDRVLAGGFFPQNLVTLGAAPAAGKTIIAQQIVENIARSGRAKVLYFNLEMSVEQLLARSISRDTGLTALEILQGYKWTPEQEARITMAAKRYKEKVAPFIAYNPMHPSGVAGSAFYQDIIETMEAEANRKDLTIPLIAVIDYLQLLRDRDGKADDVEIIKSSLKAFKDFAVKYNAVVLLIMAHSRDNNTKGTVTQAAGRDSSSIEYSGDVQLSLNYTMIANGTFKNLEEMTACIRAGKNIPNSDKKADDRLFNLRSLCVTKHRFSPSDSKTRADLLFVGEESKFDLQEQEKKIIKLR